MNSPYEGEFRVTQIFKGAPHKGLDLVGVTSKKLHSTVDGVIDAVGWDVNPKDPSDKRYGMGLRVRIKEDLTGHMYYYAHCSEVYVKQGQRVKKRELIAKEGSTGHSTGSHLHYEVRQTPKPTTFLDVVKISEIPNKVGRYTQEEDEEMPKVYNTIDEMPSWAQPTMKKLLKNKYITSLGFTEEALRIFVVNDRAGLYK